MVNIVAIVCTVIAFAAVGLSIFLEFFFAKGREIAPLNIILYSLPRDIGVFIFIMLFSCLGLENFWMGFNIWLLGEILIIVLVYIIIYQPQTNKFKAHIEFMTNFKKNMNTFDDINDALVIKRKMIDKIKFDRYSYFYEMHTEKKIYPEENEYRTDAKFGFECQENLATIQKLYKNRCYYIQVHYRWVLDKDSKIHNELIEFTERAYRSYEDTQKFREFSNQLPLRGWVVLPMMRKPQEYRIGQPIYPFVKVFKVHTYDKFDVPEFNFIDKVKIFFCFEPYLERFPPIVPETRHIVINFLLKDIEKATYKDDLKLDIDIKNYIKPDDAVREKVFDRDPYEWDGECMVLTEEEQKMYDYSIDSWIKGHHLEPNQNPATSDYHPFINYDLYSDNRTTRDGKIDVAFELFFKKALIQPLYHAEYYDWEMHLGINSKEDLFGY